VSASAHGSVRAGPVGTFRNCGSSADHAKNLVISIVPDSPKAGQLVTTTFEYDLDKEVTGGSASYGFSFNGIPFSPTVDDLCADQAGGCCPDPCPLAVGHHINKSESDFPSVSGKIVTTIKWSDQDDEQILCVVSSHRDRVARLRCSQQVATSSANIFTSDRTHPPPPPVFCRSGQSRSEHLRRRASNSGAPLITQGPCKTKQRSAGGKATVIPQPFFYISRLESS
jgi:hypothetical protein